MGKQKKKNTNGRKIKIIMCTRQLVAVAQNHTLQPTERETGAA